MRSIHCYLYSREYSKEIIDSCILRYMKSRPADVEFLFFFVAAISSYMFNFFFLEKNLEEIGSHDYYFYD